MSKANQGRKFLKTFFLTKNNLHIQLLINFVTNFHLVKCQERNVIIIFWHGDVYSLFFSNSIFSIKK